MHLDVLDLRAFYYRTRLGRSAQRVLQEALRRPLARHPRHGDRRLRLRRSRCCGRSSAMPRRVIALMPGPQGVMPWPAGGPNVSVLVEETRWPIEAGSVDRLIVAHGLETCDGPEALLAEIWRVLAPGGRVVFIVPNRSGLWARRDVTPFGFGRPYSFGQLEALLRRNRFAPERHAAALYAPPSHRKFWLQTAYFWERLGRRFEPARRRRGAARRGVEAGLRPAPPAGSKVAVPGPLDVLEGLAGPKPEPVRGHGRTAARAQPRLTSRGEAGPWCHRGRSMRRAVTARRRRR